MTAALADHELTCTRTLIIDDHQLLAQSLALALGLQGLHCHVPALAEPGALIDEVVGWAPDLVLLDLDLGIPGGNGTDLVGPLVARGCRVIVVTAATETDVLAATLEDGASGIIDKRLPFDQLLSAVLSAARGEVVMGLAERSDLIMRARRGRAERAEHLAPFQQLTDAEAGVLRSLVDGEAVASIARRRWVSEATVRSQVRAVLAKLGVTSQLEAVALAHRTGWVSAS